MSLAVGQQMTAGQARALTDRIRTALTVAYDSLIEAWQGRADLALGYDTWDDYCSQEFAEGRMVRLDREQRREIVGQMTQAGMSTRAIGTALGVNHSTVVRDLPTGADAPVGVTGINGKTYNRARSTGQIESDEDDDLPLTQEECEALEAAAQPQVSKLDTPRQRPLPDAFFDASYDLIKAVERVQRLVNDARFPRNAKQVAAKHRSDLLRAHGVLADAIDRLPTA